jgi:hypothetical protein
MPPPLRVAVYWTPERGDPLAEAGHAWLGRDPDSGIALPQPPVPGIEAATAAPRRYGFHATLRPPMRLATGWDAFRQTAASIASRIAPFDLPKLIVDDLSGFLALREASPCPPLQALADACVRATNHHRPPADAAELAQRRDAALSAEEDALLLRWGYPYVMQCWRFHMTLTCRLQATDMARLRPQAEAYFAATLRAPRRVSEIAIFTQPAGPDGAASAPFVVAERLKLIGPPG